MPSKAPPEDPVLQRLDTIIRLQAQIAVASMKETKDKVLFLSGAGLGPTAISDMLSVSVDTVKSARKRARKAAAAKNNSADGEEA
jgi:DNA-directed RNA polymerase specialized sigma24 family protein